MIELVESVPARRYVDPRELKRLQGEGQRFLRKRLG